uniref:serine/arginine repetitive matrix protein 2-like n=1 Tax=Callithrix jacchus TaxID=9483 RepID=UPI0023DCEDBE|nr:serine/arginine repetitive matrix protein 2-like [Callithrix jacchus]
MTLHSCPPVAERLQVGSLCRRKCPLCSGFHHQPAHARSWKTQQHRLYFRLAPREGPASENFTVPRLWRRHSDAPPAHRRASSDITATCLRGTDGPSATSPRHACGAQTGLRRHQGGAPPAHRRATRDVTAALLRRTDGPPATSGRRASGAQTGHPRRHGGAPPAHRRASRDVTEADLRRLHAEGCCLGAGLSSPQSRAWSPPPPAASCALLAGEGSVTDSDPAPCFCGLKIEKSHLSLPPT